MMNKKNVNFINKNLIRSVEAEAFFNGTQNIPIENSLAEMTADFAGRQEVLCRETAEKLKDLEGAVEVNRQLRADGETRWQMWREMTDGIVPPWASPFGKIAAAFAAMAGEAVLLAPLMDLFGVAYYEFQFVLATVVVIVLALLCELPIYLWREKVNRYAVYAVGASIGLGLIALGVFRAFGLAAIEAKKSPLISGFLDDNSLLSAVVIVFLTAGLPIGAAFAFELGWHGLSRCRQWKKSRKDALNYAKLHEISIKKLEAETERRAKRIAELDELRETWLNAQRQAHDEGTRLKARRKPFWEISFLIFGGCLLIAVLMMAFAYIFCDEFLLDHIDSGLGRFTVYLAATLGAMSLFTFYVVKRWNSPNARQLYTDRTVVFHTENDRQPKIFGQLSDEKRIIPEVTKSAAQNGKFA